jgi:PST family polysaccharide transporter
MRFFNIGIKFLLVGYLVRVFGEFGYGQITWVDSIIQYFILFINFGFNIYASKRVVELRGDKDALNEIVSSIYIIKICLFLASFIILLLLMFNSKINAISSFFYIYLLTGIGEVFYPIWFFQGMERMRSATIVIFFSRILILILTFLFVKDNSDITLYLWILVLSGIVLAILSIYILKTSFQIEFVKVSFYKLKNILNDSKLYFWGRAMNLAFNSVTIFVIGYAFTMEDVTIFDISSKLVMVALIPFDMLQQAMFPTITRTLNKKLLKQIIKYTFLLSLIILVTLNIFASELLFLMGGENLTQHVVVLKVLSLLIPIVALVFVLGSTTLVAFGFEKEFNYSLIFSTTGYLLLLLGLFLTDTLTFWNILILRIVAEFIMLLIRGYYTLKLVF